MTIALIGPGAIGGTVAACLSRRHPDLTLCARSAVGRLVVDGPSGRIEASPRVLTDPALASVVDWVLIATKTYDAAATALWLARLVGPPTRVAVLQNGVEHIARFAPWVAPGRIVPVIVELPAERTAPGVIVQRRDGWLQVPAGPDGDAFCALFEGSGIEAGTSLDWPTVAWWKLAVNCAGAVSALTGKPSGIVARPDIAGIMRGLVAECLAVGRAEGAVLPDDLPDEIVRRYRASPADSVNSLLADRLAGRAMEWDARNGVIARLGARHGIETPMNAMAASLLAAME